MRENSVSQDSAVRKIQFWQSPLESEEGVGIVTHFRLSSRTRVLLLPPLSGWWDVHAADDPFSENSSAFSGPSVPLLTFGDRSNTSAFDPGRPFVGRHSLCTDALVHHHF